MTNITETKENQPAQQKPQRIRKYYARTKKKHIEHKIV